MKQRTRAGLLLLALLFGAGIWYAWRTVNHHQIAGRYIPVTTALTGGTTGLAEEVMKAESSARGWLDPVKGMVELSRLYHANGYYPEAMQCYEGLELMEPANPRWPHLHASVLANFGRMDEALPLRELAVRLAPDYVPARLRLGDVLLKANQPEGAAKVYAEVLRREPGNPYALLGLARSDIAASDWTRARQRLEEDVARNPEFIGALSLLVTVNEHFGEWAAAEELKKTIDRREFSDLPDPWLDELSEVCYDAYRLSVTAAVAAAAGNRTDAVELLDRAMALAPTASSYPRQAGQLHYTASNYSAAKKLFEKAVELNSTDADAWLLLLMTLRALHQDSSVLNTLLLALSHCPQSSGLHVEYARWLREAGRLEEALAEFRSGFQLRPTEASPLVEAAAIQFLLKRPDDAVASLRHAIDLQPGHPMAMATLMIYLITTNDEAGARAQWEQIRRQTRTPGPVVESLKTAFRQQFGRALP